MTIGPVRSPAHPTVGALQLLSFRRRWSLSSTAQARICTEQQPLDGYVDEYNHLRDRFLETVLEDSCSVFEPERTEMAKCRNILVQPLDTRGRASLLSSRDSIPSSTNPSYPIDSNGYVSASSIDRKQIP